MLGPTKANRPGAVNTRAIEVTSDKKHDMPQGTGPPLAGPPLCGRVGRDLPVSDLPDSGVPGQFMAGLYRGQMAADHFTIVSNLVARDPAISYKAKGVFLNMASHKEGFRITERLLTQQGKDGVAAIRAALEELRAAGYVYRGERTRHPAGTRDGQGRSLAGALAGHTWFVTDKPDEVAAILKQRAAETSDDGEDTSRSEQPSKIA